MLLLEHKPCREYLRSIAPVCCGWHLVLTLQQLSAGEDDLPALSDPQGSGSKCWHSSQPNCWGPVLSVMWMDSLSQLFSPQSPPPLLRGRWGWVCPRKMLLHCLFYVYLGEEQGSCLFCVLRYNRGAVISGMYRMIVFFLPYVGQRGSSQGNLCS